MKKLYFLILFALCCGVGFSQCTLSFGEPTYICGTNTAGDNNDDVTFIDIPFTGGGIGTGDSFTVSANLFSMVTGDNPLVVENGTMRLIQANVGDLMEGDAWSLTITGGLCDGDSASGTVPAAECDPVCELAFGTPSYVCGTNTAGDDNDNVTFIDIPFTGGGSGTGDSFTISANLFSIVTGDNPLVVESGTVRLIQADEGELMEGDAWSLAISGGLCDGESTSGTIPSSECDPTCELTFGTPTYVCGTNTEGDNNDNVTFIDIPFTGGGSGTGDSFTVSANLFSMVTGDNPLITESGTLRLIQADEGDLTEGDAWSLAISGGLCDGESTSGTIPAAECDPTCELAFGTPEYVCGTNTEGDNNDNVTFIDIPFTGGGEGSGTSFTVSANLFALISGDNPLMVESGTLRLIQADEGELAEGDAWSFAISGELCDGESVSGTIPAAECDPTCELVFGTPEYVCNTNTEGDNNDNVTFIDIPFTGGGSGSGTSIDLTDNLFDIIIGDNPLTVESGTMRLSQANPGDLVEGDLWVVTVLGGLCNGASINGQIPVSECDPVCELVFGTPEYVCETNTEGDNNDNVTFIDIPFTGGGSGIGTSLSLSSNLFSITLGDNPLMVESGTLRLTQANPGDLAEGDLWTLQVTELGDLCNGASVNGQVPPSECDPVCELVFGTPEYVCETNTEGDNNDNVTFIDIPFTGGGEGSGDAINLSDNLFAITLGDNPLMVESGTLRLTQANPGELVEGDIWTLMIDGGLCHGAGANGQVPVSECDPVCELTFGTPEYVCETNTEGDNNDNVTFIDIPFTGGGEGSGTSLVLSDNLFTITLGDNPLMVESGTLRLTQANPGELVEGDLWTLRVDGGLCHGAGANDQVPVSECDPVCELVFGTPEYVCETETEGDNNDNVTFIDIPFTGGGEGSGTSLVLSDNLFTITLGDNPLEVESGTLRLTQANPGELVEGSFWTLTVDGGLCLGSGANGFVPANECDPVCELVFGTPEYVCETETEGDNNDNVTFIDIPFTGGGEGSGTSLVLSDNLFTITLGDNPLEVESGTLRLTQANPGELVEGSFWTLTVDGGLCLGSSINGFVPANECDPVCELVFGTPEYVCETNTEGDNNDNVTFIDIPFTGGGEGSGTSLVLSDNLFTITLGDNPLEVESGTLRLTQANPGELVEGSFWTLTVDGGLCLGSGANGFIPANECDPVCELVFGTPEYVCETETEGDNNDNVTFIDIPFTGGGEGSGTSLVLSDNLFTITLGDNPLEVESGTLRLTQANPGELVEGSFWTLTVDGGLCLGSGANGFVPAAECDPVCELVFGTPEYVCETETEGDNNDNVTFIDIPFTGGGEGSGTSLVLSDNLFTITLGDNPLEVESGTLRLTQANPGELVEGSFWTLTVDGGLCLGSGANGFVPANECDPVCELVFGTPEYVCETETEGDNNDNVTFIDIPFTGGGEGSGTSLVLSDNLFTITLGDNPLEVESGTLRLTQANPGELVEGSFWTLTVDGGLCLGSGANGFVPANECDPVCELEFGTPEYVCETNTEGDNNDNVTFIDIPFTGGGEGSGTSIQLTDNLFSITTGDNPLMVESGTLRLIQADPGELVEGDMWVVTVLGGLCNGTSINGFIPANECDPVCELVFGTPEYVCETETEGDNNDNVTFIDIPFTGGGEGSGTSLVLSDNLFTITLGDNPLEVESGTLRLTQANPGELVEGSFWTLTVDGGLCLGAGSNGFIPANECDPVCELVFGTPEYVCQTETEGDNNDNITFIDIPFTGGGEGSGTSLVLSDNLFSITAGDNPLMVESGTLRLIQADPGELIEGSFWTLTVDGGLCLGSGANGFVPANECDPVCELVFGTPEYVCETETEGDNNDNVTFIDIPFTGGGEGSGTSLVLSDNLFTITLGDNPLEVESGTLRLTQANPGELVEGSFWTLTVDGGLCLGSGANGFVPANECDPVCELVFGTPEYVCETNTEGDNNDNVTFIDIPFTGGGEGSGTSIVFDTDNLFTTVLGDNPLEVESGTMRLTQADPGLLVEGAWWAVRVEGGLCNGAGSNGFIPANECDPVCELVFGTPEYVCETETEGDNNDNVTFIDIPFTGGGEGSGTSLVLSDNLFTITLGDNPLEVESGTLRLTQANPGELVEGSFWTLTVDGGLCLGSGANGFVPANECDPVCELVFGTPEYVCQTNTEGDNNDNVTFIDIPFTGGGEGSGTSIVFDTDNLFTTVLGDNPLEVESGTMRLTQADPGLLAEGVWWAVRVEGGLCNGAGSNGFIPANECDPVCELEFGTPEYVCQTETEGDNNDNVTFIDIPFTGGGEGSGTSIQLTDNLFMITLGDNPLEVESGTLRVAQANPGDLVEGDMWVVTVLGGLCNGSSINGFIPANECDPVCELEFGTPEYVCQTETEGDNNDNVTFIDIPFTGGGEGSGTSIQLSDNLFMTTLGDNPLEVESGTLRVAQANPGELVEGDMWVVTVLGGLCNGSSINGFIPANECDPVCELVFGTPEYVCETNTDGDNNDNVAFIDVPFTGGGEGSGTSIQLSNNLFMTTLGDDPLTVESGTLRLSQADPGLLEEGSFWTLTVIGGLCNGGGINGFIPAAECDPVCELEFGTPEYVCETNTEGDNNDNITFIDIPFTGGGTGIATSIQFDTTNLSTTIMGDDPLMVESGTMRLVQADPGELVEGDWWAIRVEGGLCNGSSINGFIPAAECDPVCELEFGEPMYVCETNTEGDNNDNITFIDIPFTGGGTGIATSIQFDTTNLSTTIMGDNPLMVESGTMRLVQADPGELVEGDWWAIRVEGGLCNGRSANGFIPAAECDPICELEFGTPEYVCGTSTVGDNNDNVTFIDIPFTGGGTGSGTSIQLTDNLSMTTLGDNPLMVESGTIRLVQADPGELVEGSFWTLTVLGGLCNGTSINDFIPASECDELGVEEVESNYENVKVYINSLKELEVSGLNAESIDIYNVNGQLVARGKSSADVSKLPNGVYIALILDDKNIKVSRKFIKR